jgi:selenocysteine-specific elongation factor
LADDVFRMPVDRVFSLAGAGTVVTGTAWSGSIGAGQEVTVLPQGFSARVRSVEVHGARQERAEPGRRTALALPGVDRAGLSRGSVVVADRSWRHTTVLDVELTLLPGAPRPLTQRSRVRCHLGTAEVMARITPGGDAITPGEVGVARLRLEQPVVARWGDRIIVRAYSPVTTIGGATVIDPWPPGRPRRPVRDARRLAPDFGVRLTALVELSGLAGVPIADLAVRAGIPLGDIAATVQAAAGGDAIVRLGDVLYPASALRNVADRILAVLAGYHQASPLSPGMPLEALRAAVGESPLGETMVTRLAGTMTIVLEGGCARLPSHQPMLDASQAKVGQDLLATLEAAGGEGATATDLALRFPNGTAGGLLEYYVRQGTAIRVGSDRYYHREQLGLITRRVLEEVDRRGEVNVGQVRDAVGLTRKFLIPLLEWLDSRGLTTRAGDARRLTPAGRRWLDAVPDGP